MENSRNSVASLSKIGFAIVVMCAVYAMLFGLSGLMTHPVALLLWLPLAIRLIACMPPMAPGEGPSLPLPRGMTLFTLSLIILVGTIISVCP